MISPEEISALLQVIVVDLVLAGDNAIVVGMVVAGLPKHQRPKAMLIGIAAAALMRIGLAVFTLRLLEIIGLMLAGGLLLLWVCWKLWREIQEQRRLRKNQGTDRSDTESAPSKSMGQAIFQIVLADISMSLDNVLAVAGVARHHTWVLIVGLTLSVAFMAFAATVISKLLQRHHWIAYIGLALIFYVSCAMIWDGAHDVIEASHGLLRE